MTFRSKFITLSVAAAALVVASAGYAQTAQAPASAAAPGSRLNLTEAQRDEVRAIREAQRKERQPLQEKMRAARQALREAMRADVPDEAAVRSAAGALGALQADRAALRARGRGQFMNLLTPEQRAQVNAARARAEQRTQRMRMRADRMMRQRLERWRRDRQ